MSGISYESPIATLRSAYHHTSKRLSDASLRSPENIDTSKACRSVRSVGSVRSVEILIPQHISKLGVLYSVPILFTTSYVAFHAEHYVLALIVYFLYRTSMAHWSCIYKTGPVRDWDIATVRFTVLYITLVSTYSMTTEMVRVWYIAVGTVQTVFCINEAILYYGLNSRIDTYQREQIMYFVVVIHMAVVHYGLPLTAMYCLSPV